MASGTLQRHIGSTYRISKSHMGKIVDQVCIAIGVELTKLMPELTKAKFVEISNEFNNIWNFPNVCGAIDGKHCSIKCPKNSGTLFYNYKVTVLLLIKILKFKH